MMSWRTHPDFIPGPLEFHLWDLSWCFQPGEFVALPRPILHLQDLVPGSLWLPKSTELKKDSFPPVPDTGMEQSRSSTGWDKSKNHLKLLSLPLAFRILLYF